MSFPLYNVEYSLENDLHNSREVTHFLDSQTENEENTSKQIKLEDKYSFIFTLEGTPIHDPISQKYYKHLKYQHEIHPDDLHSDFTKLVDDQSYFLGEKPEVSNLEEALKSSLRVQKCRGVKPLNSQSVDCFAQKSHVLGNPKSHSGKVLHKCPECGYSSLRISDLSRHQRLHTGERPYECTVCKKQFARQAYLRMHQKRHSEVETYKCLECGKNFRHRSSLKRHVTTHTGEKPHRCESCGKSFVQLTALTLHQRTHTKEKPFKCSYCGKTFTQKPNLVTLLRIHRGEKPYKCNYCSKCFRQRTGLIVHQVSHFFFLLIKKRINKTIRNHSNLHVQSLLEQLGAAS
ncbi:uncharacterized protein LOC143671732 [Tamandua tetradactyla]|uniref:uncharacterized protein LOC143671732 n=1 Tax=Tamandua tetradactyla TaxID=48850 RepID=UPI004054493F